MAFLDNSGDIILDAVLTDTGRLRLAQGDGSFKITKFALGDDEINYGNYNKDHTSGSAYYDLEILQTPVLEAFTNNTSNLNSKLMSIARTNLLFMPELLLNKKEKLDDPIQALDSRMYHREDFTAGISTGDVGTPGGYNETRFVVAVDDNTYKSLRYGSTTTAADNATGDKLYGLMKGYVSSQGGPISQIRVDQGLNTTQINPSSGLDSDLIETQYIIELDYRLGRLAQPAHRIVADVNFIDDDNIASYYVAGTNGFVVNNPYTGQIGDDGYSGKEQVHQGPRGTSLFFRLHASSELQYSTYLFNQLGKKLTEAQSKEQLGVSQAILDSKVSSGTGYAYVIDTTVRVTGANTGFRIDIPVRYLKIDN